MDWYVVRLEGGRDEDAGKLLSDDPLKPRLAPKLTEDDQKEKIAAKSDENGGRMKE